MLKGTEKQVKWAEDVINKALTQLEDVLNTVTNNTYIDPSDNQESLVCKTEEQFNIEVETLKTLIEKIKEEESAKFIIENRENLILAIAANNNLVRFRKIINAYNRVKGL